MMVLVAYATRQGATAGIADQIAAALTATGLSAEARPVEDVKKARPDHRRPEPGPVSTRTASARPSTTGSATRCASLPPDRSS